MSEPVKQRASLALGFVGGRAQSAVVKVEVNAAAQFKGAPGLPVNGFNRPREKDELIVFTPEFHRTTLTSGDGLEVIIRHNRVSAVQVNAGSQPIPADGYVLSAHGSAREALLRHAKIGAALELKIALTYAPTLPFNAEFVLGGGPQLLSAGQPVLERDAPGYADSFYKMRHPRTAIGWRADGQFVLVTVDGRQPQQSVGMTIAELAALMQQLGCVEALNLDGGGSTTMVINQKVVNRPSDATGERAVSDALLLFARPAVKVQPKR